MNNQLELDKRAPAQSNEEGVGPLLSGIADDLEKLVSQHLELLKTEFKQDVREAKEGLVYVGVSAGMGLLGAVFLLLSLAQLLHLAGLPMWASYGLLGLSLTITAVFLFYRGREHLAEASPVPDETIAELKEDTRWIKKQM